MNDNLSGLKRIPSILEIKRILPNQRVKEKLGRELYKEALTNSKKVFAYSILYKSKGKKIRGFLVEPREGKNLPCIIWNRGGSRDFGSIRIGGLFINRTIISSLAIKGYIVIMTQYPGVAGGEGLDQMGSDDDIASILDLKKILNAYSRADSNRIGMYGHSRGGTMTYMCLRKVKWIKAAVIGAGPCDYTNAKQFRPKMVAHYKKMFGGSLIEKKKRSAIFWTEKLPKKTPLFIMHGTSDWRVNPQDSIRMADKLYSLKIPFKFILFEGDDHSLSANSEEYINQTVKWFERFLTNKEALPKMKPHGR